MAEIKKIPNACDEYRHFKGNEYQVKDIAIDTRKPDLLVIYADKKTPTKIWARPFREWIETITRDGKTFSRFTKND
ncbi:MAG: DUF1653 domain-containing protein [Clostridia bacterium]|nr:DUF1653 domain-containing protein [Clostridia bacterium]